MKFNVGESITAAAIIAFGVFMLALGSSYSMGSMSEMGPGYFPVLLGIITALVGLVTLLSVWRSDAPVPDIPWAPAGLILASILAWALMAERLGLVPATFSVVILSSLARPPVRILPVLLMSAIASAASVLVFIHGFTLPLKAFNW
jgi:hypothetical protein